MADFVNLKAETLRKLNHRGYTVDDIAWVGSEELEIPVDRFFKLADEEYDSGYGAAKVCQDLVICMKDGSWFERDEYDGAEWWTHRRYPRRPSVFMAEAKTVFSKDSWYAFFGECNLEED